MHTEYLKEAEFLLRILLATVCGGVVGYERKNRGKGAGVRTHTIVAVASCLMMIVSQYGFMDFLDYAKNIKMDTTVNPTRVAAQIVSGVGFLGAGMIFVQKKVVTGLTTAAGIWAVSGIGMAIGGGMYLLGIACSILIVIIQIIYHKNIGIFHFATDEPITVWINDTENAVENVLQIFQQENIPASVTGFAKEDGCLEINITASPHQGNDISLVISELQKNQDIQKVKM